MSDKYLEVLKDELCRAEKEKQSHLRKTFAEWKAWAGFCIALEWAIEQYQIMVSNEKGERSEIIRSD
jgi:hypothetical protein